MVNRALTISEVTSQIKNILEESLPTGWVVGEVSDFTQASSGHCYWTLRDKSSQISCVMFRFHAQKLTFVPKPGVQLLAYGNVSVYERGGRYQLYVYHVQPVGVGEMAIAFERLRERLESEGLFARERKRPLPRFPKSIGVVTSGSGAAFRDILQVASRRAPGVQIVLRPTRVQGVGAAEAIAAGISDLNAHLEVDILIVGRGGGSPEDLWPFNEEVVARAIHASEVPVVSAVGHEIDYTISDYVADLRAPTPSAAAELVTPDQEAVKKQLDMWNQGLTRRMRARLEEAHLRMQDRTPAHLEEALRDRLEQAGQRLDETRVELATAYDRCLRKMTIDFEHAVIRLRAVDPLAGLSRGFVYCSHEDGRRINCSSELTPGDRVHLRFARGEARCVVEEASSETAIS